MLHGHVFLCTGSNSISGVPLLFPLANVHDVINLLSRLYDFIANHVIRAGNISKQVLFGYSVKTRKTILKSYIA